MENGKSKHPAVHVQSSNGTQFLGRPVEDTGNNTGVRWVKLSPACLYNFFVNDWTYTDSKCWEVLARGYPSDPFSETFEPIRDADGAPVLIDPETLERLGAAMRQSSAEVYEIVRRFVEKLNAKDDGKLSAALRVLCSPKIYTADAFDSAQKMLEAAGREVTTSKDEPVVVQARVIPDVAEGMSIAPTAADLRSMFKATVVPLQGDAPWAYDSLYQQHIAVLHRGDDVRVLTISTKDIELKGRCLEPDLPKVRRRAQAWLAVCIDKAKTFWEPKR